MFWQGASKIIPYVITQSTSHSVFLVLDLENTRIEFLYWENCNKIIVIRYLHIKLSLTFCLPQNNPEMESFWSSLSFETSFVKFHYETKKCFQKTFFRLFCGIWFFYAAICNEQTSPNRIINKLSKWCKSKMAKKNSKMPNSVIGVF